MRRSRRHQRVAGALLVAVAAIAGCSSDDGGRVALPSESETPTTVSKAEVGHEIAVEAGFLGSPKWDDGVYPALAEAAASYCAEIERAGTVAAQRVLAGQLEQITAEFRGLTLDKVDYADHKLLILRDIAPAATDRLCPDIHGAEYLDGAS